MTIFITGAAQGIGAATAHFLAHAGHQLLLADYQADKLAETAARCREAGVEVTELPGDLTDPQTMQRCRDSIGSQTIDVLINNAAVAHKLMPFTELSEDQLDLALKLNIKAVFQLIQAVLPSMQARGSGQILNVASRANIYGYEHMGIYAATKAAITSFSGTIALENPQLKAVTIVPGRTNTPMQAELRGQEVAQGSQTPEFVGETIAKIINGEIPTQSGDHVLIDFGQYKVISELTKADLHSHMH